MTDQTTNDPEAHSDEGPTPFKACWFTYIAECSDGSLYTGITNDLRGRLQAHNRGEGAGWTRLRRPVRMIHAEPFPDKSAARKRELEIKGFRREKKWALAHSPSNQLPCTIASPSGASVTDQ